MEEVKSNSCNKAQEAEEKQAGTPQKVLFLGRRGRAGWRALQNNSTEDDLEAEYGLTARRLTPRLHYPSRSQITQVQIIETAGGIENTTVVRPMCRNPGFLCAETLRSVPKQSAALDSRLPDTTVSFPAD